MFPRPFPSLKIGLLALVSVSFIPGCAVVADGFDVRSALDTAAPDFSLGWEIAFADVRTNRELEQIMSRYDRYPDQDDSARLTTDTLDFLIESGQPIPPVASSLAGYGVDPDSYVMLAFKSGELTDTSVQRQFAGCSIGTRPEAAQNGSTPLVMVRDCLLTREFYAQSEQDVEAMYQSWQQQSLAIGGLMARQELPEGWAVTHYAINDVVSTTPITPFYKMEFAPSQWGRTDSPVIATGGDVVQRLKIETSPPRFSDVYGAWGVTIYVSLELHAALSQTDATKLHSGRYFE